MFLIMGLFITSLLAFMLLIVPAGEFHISPATTATSKVRRSLNNYFFRDNKREIMQTLGRSTKEILKTGVIVGFGLALIVIITTFKFLGPYSALLAITAFLFGVLSTDKVVESEYKKWQEELFTGIPALVNFVPAFLEVQGITAREALYYSLPFIPQPLRGEMEEVINKIKRTGRVQEPLKVLSKKANNSVVDAICIRLSSAWDTKISSDIFDDLSEQVESINELAVNKSTVAKTGYLTLISVLGLIGVTLIFGYPGIKFLANQLTGSFI